MTCISGEWGVEINSYHHDIVQNIKYRTHNTPIPYTSKLLMSGYSSAHGRSRPQCLDIQARSPLQLDAFNCNLSPSRTPSLFRSFMSLAPSCYLSSSPGTYRMRYSGRREGFTRSPKPTEMTRAKSASRKLMPAPAPPCLARPVRTLATKLFLCTVLYNSNR